MDRYLIDYLPPVLKEVRELKLVNQVLQDEVDTLWGSFDDALNEQFIKDDASTAYAASRWESMLGIIPKSTDTLGIRKFRILTRIGSDVRYTLKALKQQLETLCGVDGYILSVSGYTLTVRVALGIAEQYTEVQTLLNLAVPANMIIDLSLLYNTYDIIAGLANHTYSQLTQYTYEFLRSGVLS